jgi:hypothetical protein
MRKVRRLKNSFSTIASCGRLVATAAFILVVSCDSRGAKAPRFTSFSNLYSIGVAISRYKYDHGQLPQELSELLPEYIPYGQIAVFYVTNNEVQNPSVPADWASNPSRIDQLSSYVYLGTNNVHGILAFEKTDLWKPGISRESEVAVLFVDFHVEYFSIQKLRELLPAKVPVKK